MSYCSPQFLLPPNSAVFLDIDGTLLNLAATPNSVIVPPHLPELLRRLSIRLGGALALISGRSLTDIDAMFGLGLAVAAEHGAILRDAAGRALWTTPVDPALASLIGPLRAAVAARPGTLLEEKRLGLALHWRGAPHFSASLTASAIALAAPHPGLLLQPAHEALEIRVRGPGKAVALDMFMREPPFVGRLPVFVGDDLTDEPAIARAGELGGCGLHVGRDFTGGPAAVIAWLEAGFTEIGNNGHA
ncbi:MAG: trehalose-phosphatase [Acidocella sp. 20-61-6]|nr:MAG: trehalose-phosphatase [Acidocella sp. 20-61-6]